MKINYKCIILALFAGVLAWPVQAQNYTECPTDQDECLVEWANSEGSVIINALRNTIENDTDRPDGRVYKLKRGGFYWNEDHIVNDGWHLRIIGETDEEAPSERDVCGPNQDEDCGPAVIQRVTREDGSIDQVMVQSQGSGGDLTMENVWLMGQDDTGARTAYEPLQLDASDSRFVFDNVIFDRNDWHHIGVNGENDDLFITNSHFRNIFGPSQRWEGLGVRLEVGADTVVIENNTFLNIGFTPFQSEAAPANYLRFNHNTIVNMGRSISAGFIWKEAYFANNLMVNPFWQGEDEGQYGDPDREDPYAGIFSIGELPARFGTNAEREVLLANNSTWRDPAFSDYYESQDPIIRPQPFINDTTGGWFAMFDGMVMQDNYVGVRPNLETYPGDLVDDMIANITEIRAESTPAARYYYDPGRDEECYECNIWPLPEDFSYTNEQLLNGGTDGLPVGDLNWFPDAKEDFLSNKEQYVSDVENLARGAELEVTATTQAEDGTLNDQSSVEIAEGDAFFDMQGGGFIEWTFNVDETDTYSLIVYTRAANEDSQERGQNLILDGTALLNQPNSYGEYFFASLPLDEWLGEEITQGELGEGGEALDMDAGEHTFEITPSWGYQYFQGVDVVNDAGETVVSMSAKDAVSEGVSEVCTEAAYCPQGFRSVALNSGGEVSWNFDAPSDGEYQLRVFYASSGGAQGEVSVDGEPVDGITFDADTSNAATSLFDMSGGSRTVSVSSEQGGVNIDYVQLIRETSTAIDPPGSLPEGYALHQSYPNPFTSSATIEYTMGQTGDVRLVVYDVLGRRVRTLVDRTATAGTHTVQFDGKGLASGLYFYRLKTPVGQQTRTMTLVK